MTMTTSSSSSQIHTATTLDPHPPEPKAHPAAGSAEDARPTVTAGPPGPAAVAQALNFETIPIELLREHFTKWLIETLTHGHFPAGSDDPTPAAAPETAVTGPTGGATAPKPKRAKSANRPPTRKRESPLADATPPPQQPESAPSARPQYVRMGDKSVWLTKPMLRARGWTESAIRDHLPGPEALKPNPRFAVSGAPMPVWRPATVAKAESDPKWRAWLERSLQRRQTTLAALADSPDPEFRSRLELADQAIKDSLVPATLLESLEPAM